jgi:predicted RNA-binding Zn-ribbon protein involved in translation (DUF1610 family)
LRLRAQHDSPPAAKRGDAHTWLRDLTEWGLCGLESPSYHIGTRSMMFLCPTCGNIVSREDVGMNSDLASCSECVRSGKTIKWPGIWVEFQPRNAVPERLRQMSIGYLKSAQTLCCDLGEHPEHLDWPRACVAYFCVYHAVELFLKACILLRAPPGEKLHHSVSKLQDRYRELYPEIKETVHIS